MFKQHIRTPFRIDAGSGRVALESSEETYVANLIRTVLLTTPGERVNRPDFGCGLQRMVFSPVNSATLGLVKIMVLESLEKELGSVIKVNEVSVRSEASKLVVDIGYTILSRNIRKYLNIEVES